MLFLHAFDQPFPTWWTTRPSKTALITGWTAGPQLGGLGDIGSEDLITPALHSLAAALDVPIDQVARYLEGWYCHDWRKDPFAEGAYSWVLAGGLDAWRNLAEPLDGSLYFAGEATAGEGYNATMEGALLSGTRAAREILES
jgi:monoamine oxidase